MKSKVEIIFLIFIALVAFLKIIGLIFLKGLIESAGLTKLPDEWQLFFNDTGMLASCF